MAEEIQNGRSRLMLFFAFYVNSWYCGRNSFRSFSCILLKYVVHVRLLIRSSLTISIMAEKNSKWPINCYFSHFLSIIWPCVRDNLKSLSCILLNFFMYVANKQFSDKFDNGWKKIKMTDLLWFCHFTSIIWPYKGNNLFLIMAGGGLLSSALLLVRRLYMSL